MAYNIQLFNRRKKTIGSEESLVSVEKNISSHKLNKAIEKTCQPNAGPEQEIQAQMKIIIEKSAKTRTSSGRALKKTTKTSCSLFGGLAKKRA